MIAHFDSMNPQGAPQVFLLHPWEVDANGLLPKEETWVPALLPIQPNGTIGYLPVEALHVSKTSYRIVVNRAAFELTLWKGSEIFLRVPVGIGAGATPTPVGRFFITSLLRPPEPGSVYGDYAYGLSGFSETLDDWAGGGVIGIHGTNDPSSVGRSVSHGCIRLRNRDIKQLVPIIPLGTPVEVV